MKKIFLIALMLSSNAAFAQQYPNDTPLQQYLRAEAGYAPQPAPAPQPVQTQQNPYATAYAPQPVPAYAPPVAAASDEQPMNHSLQGMNF